MQTLQIGQTVRLSDQGKIAHVTEMAWWRGKLIGFLTPEVAQIQWKLDDFMTERTDNNIVCSKCYKKLNMIWTDHISFLEAA